MSGGPPARRMSRNTRQVVQLVGVGLVLVLLVALVWVWRGGPSAAPSGTPSVARSAGVAITKATTRATTKVPASGSTNDSIDRESGLRWVAESALPKEARTTLELIRAGGPYPYPRNDDQTFSNRESTLPNRASGYYREYTVVTPGSGDRGARRIIRGREGELYYTDDHYGSFRRVREGA
mgnify:FL=1